jgi:hypothetical protein
MSAPALLLTALALAGAPAPPAAQWPQPPSQIRTADAALAACWRGPMQATRVGRFDRLGFVQASFPNGGWAWNEWFADKRGKLQLGLGYFHLEAWQEPLLVGCLEGAADRALYGPARARGRR